MLMCYQFSIMSSSRSSWMPLLYEWSIWVTLTDGTIAISRETFHVRHRPIGLLQALALGSGVSLHDKSYLIIWFKIWLYPRAALVYRCFVYVCFVVNLLISRFFLLTVRWCSVSFCWFVCCFLLIVPRIVYIYAYVSNGSSSYSVDVSLQHASS